MAITRLQLDQELVSRRKAMLEAVGIPESPSVYPALNSPVAYAIRQCGGTVANISGVVDSDLATVDPADYDKLMDLAEYRLLMNIKGRWAKVDISSGPFSQSLSQLADQLDKDIAAMKTLVAEQYGATGATLLAGVIDLSFMETDPDASL
jgi:hypothetical protein